MNVVHQQMVNEQDQHLDEIGNIANRLAVHAKDINAELEHQGE